MLDVAKYTGGKLFQLYCHETTLADWLALIMSRGELVAAKAKPRLGFLAAVTRCDEVRKMNGKISLRCMAEGSA